MIDAEYYNEIVPRRNQSVHRFADTLERIINLLALGQFVISTGLICFAGFQITSVRFFLNCFVF